MANAVILRLEDWWRQLCEHRGLPKGSPLMDLRCEEWNNEIVGFFQKRRAFTVSFRYTKELQRVCPHLVMHPFGATELEGYLKLFCIQTLSASLPASDMILMDEHTAGQKGEVGAAAAANSL